MEGAPKSRISRAYKKKNLMRGAVMLFGALLAYHICHAKASDMLVGQCSKAFLDESNGLMGSNNCSRAVRFLPCFRQDDGNLRCIIPTVFSAGSHTAGWMQLTLQNIDWFTIRCYVGDKQCEQFQKCIADVCSGDPDLNGPAMSNVECSESEIQVKCRTVVEWGR